MSRRSLRGTWETLRVAARDVVGWALPEDEREIILGDLEELYSSWASRCGRGRATLRYFGALVSSVGSRSLSRAGNSLVRVARVFRPAIGPKAVFTHSLRALRRQPGLVLVATVTIGAGLGSAAAVFSVVNDLLLRPLPGVSAPENGAYLEFATQERDKVGVSGPVADQIRRRATLVEGIAAFDFVGVHVSLGEVGGGTEVRAYTIYGDYFEVLGVGPAAGRLLSARETGPEADPYWVVISERLAVQVFGSPGGAVARQIEINGQGFTVIGVAGGGFVGTSRNWQVDVWLPRSAFVPLTGLPVDRLWAAESRLHQDFILRPVPGVSPDAVQAEVNAILNGLSETAALTSEQEALDGLVARVRPGLSVPPQIRPRVHMVLGVLALAGTLILVISCANLANLLVVRALHERGQMAVRRALGASRVRIVGQALAESLLLAMLGAVAGLGVAVVIGSTLEGEALWGLPALEGFSVDHRVWLFGLLTLVTTALVSGALPAVVAARFDPASALSDVGAQTTSRYHVARASISTVQIGLSMTLLVGSLLLGRTVWNIYSVDSGLNDSDVYVASINDWRTERISLEELQLLREQVVALILDVEGVREVALHSFNGPYNGFLPSRIITGDQSLEDARIVASHWVTPGWFDVFDVEPVYGRLLSSSDFGASHPPAVVLTAPLAEALFGTANAVGRTVQRGIRELEEATVVGVVGDLRLVDPTNPPDEAYFMLYPGGQATPVTVLIGTERGRSAPMATVQAELQALLPGLSVPRPTLLSARIDRQIAEQRVLASLLTIFSGIAVLLSGVGLYGVMAFAVQGRRRELGIRMALGATGARLARMVLQSAGAILGAGITLGILGAHTLSQLLQSRLFEVEPLDPMVYLTGAGLLAVVALLAGWSPLRSATRIEVSETLRRE